MHSSNEELGIDCLMAKRSYLGGSSVVGRGGWFLRGSGAQRMPDAAAAPSKETKEERKARQKMAHAIRKSREAGSAELAERAAELLRAKGLSEREIRRRLKLKKR